MYHYRTIKNPLPVITQILIVDSYYISHLIKFKFGNQFNMIPYTWCQGIISRRENYVTSVNHVKVQTGLYKLSLDDELNTVRVDGEI